VDVIMGVGREMGASQSSVPPSAFWAKNPNLEMKEVNQIFIIIIYLFILIVNGVLPGGIGTTIRHNTQITHHAQTKHSTQNYKNNKGHTTYNEYNANAITTTTTTIT
jgi:hypothetical protein